eukprot:sb/3467310/
MHLWLKKSFSHSCIHLWLIDSFSHSCISHSCRSPLFATQHFSTLRSKISCEIVDLTSHVDQMGRAILELKDHTMSSEERARLTAPPTKADETTIPKAFFNFTVCIVASALLSIPYGFDKTGWLGGLILLLMVGALVDYTLICLGETCMKLNIFDYQQIAEMLGYSSMVSVASIMILTIALLYFDIKRDPANEIEPVSSQLFTGLSVFATGFVCHQIVTPTLDSLQDDNKSKKQKFHIVVHLAIGTSFLFFVSVGVMGYYLCHDAEGKKECPGNILEATWGPKEDPTKDGIQSDAFGKFNLN